MSDNLSFLLTCAAECLNNWGYDGHGKHVDDGVKEITRLRAENEKLREALKPFAYNYQNNGLSHSMFIFEMKDLLAAKKALESVNE